MSFPKLAATVAQGPRRKCDVHHKTSLSDGLLSKLWSGRRSRGESVDPPNAAL